MPGGIDDLLLLDVLLLHRALRRHASEPPRLFMLRGLCAGVFRCYVVTDSCDIGTDFRSREAEL